jgi:hypothetical protein
VEEASHAWVRGFAVVDADMSLVKSRELQRQCISQLCLDALKWCDGEQRLCGSSSESCYDGRWARDFALSIREHVPVSIEGDESWRALAVPCLCDAPGRTYASLQRVPDYKRRAPGVPLLAERRPR